MAGRKKNGRGEVEPAPSAPRRRRPVLLIAVAAAVAFLAAAFVLWRSRSGASPVSEPPGDIILVTIDTWRADAAGFAGNARVKTPFLDSLAARGVVFTNAHAHNVVTLPSHANILTGLNPYQHGVRENAGFVLAQQQVTVAERLRELGYTTGAFVAAYPLDARFGLNQGFDVYDDNYGKGRASLDFTIQERPADAVLAAASRWWSAGEGRRRFMWIHLYDPHAPYKPTGAFAETYRNAPYLGEVAAVDAALQQHLAPLLRDDVTTIITSDHGEALGDHGELTHGLFAYEATLKVPLLVVAPGLAARRDAAAVAHVDIVPTILERAGAPKVPSLPGQSLLGPLAARETYFESLSAYLNRGWAPLTGIIREDLKYIDLPVAELYHLPSDPAEKKNVFAERRREATRARQSLAAVSVLPDDERKIPADEIARLRSLGYIAGSPASRGAITAADDPKNLVHIDANLHRVVDLYQHGRGAEAVQLARSVVAEQPHMAAGRELLAFVLQQTDQIPAAIAVLESLIADGHATEANKVQLALLLTDSGRASDAAALLSSGAAAGTNPEVLNGYGVALADQGKLEEAVRQFRRVLEMDANNAPAMQNIGIAALRANDLGAAQQHLDAALALNPRLPLALNSLGVVRARRNDFEGAVEAWQRAVELDPRQYDALFNIGLVTFRTGRRNEARQALEQFVRTAPRSRYASDIAQAKQALRAIAGS